MPEEINVSVTVIACGCITIKNPAQRVINVFPTILDAVKLKVENYETFSGAMCPGAK